MKQIKKIKKSKIELECYCAESISFERHYDKIALTSPLSFVPFDLIFTEDEFKKIISTIMIGNPQLKITIEKI